MKARPDKWNRQSLLSIENSYTRYGAIYIQHSSLLSDTRARMIRQSGGGSKGMGGSFNISALWCCWLVVVLVVVLELGKPCLAWSFSPTHRHRAICTVHIPTGIPTYSVQHVLRCIRIPCFSILWSYVVFLPR